MELWHLGTITGGTERERYLFVHPYTFLSSIAWSFLMGCSLSLISRFWYFASFSSHWRNQLLCPKARHFNLNCVQKCRKDLELLGSDGVWPSCCGCSHSGYNGSLVYDGWRDVPHHEGPWGSGGIEISHQRSSLSIEQVAKDLRGKWCQANQRGA